MRCQKMPMEIKHQNRGMYYHTFRSLNPRIQMLFMIQTLLSNPSMREISTVSKNASNNHIMNDKIGSSGEQSEINAIQLEIDNDNVEGYSLGGNTDHSQSRKRKKG